MAHSTKSDGSQPFCFCKSKLSYVSSLEPYITYGIHCTTVQQEKHVLCRHVPQNHVTGVRGGRGAGASITLLMLRCELSQVTSITLLMLRCELSQVTSNTLLMLRCELSQVTSNTLLMLRCELSQVTSNTLLMLRLESKDSRLHIQFCLEIQCGQGCEVERTWQVRKDLQVKKTETSVF